MSIERRLRLLEEHTGSGVPCEQCGHVPGEPIGGRVEFLIHWPDMPELSDIEDPGPEVCPTCGRRLVFTVEWRDALSRGEGVR
jgi:uncharacterized OB-fold protein